jgi:translocation and assembly module TamA
MFFFQRAASRTLASCVLILLACHGPAEASVELQGLDKVLTQNVTARLALDDEPCDAPDWRIQHLFEEADEEIRDALEAHGYYAPSIITTLEPAADCWLARFTVDPGLPVRLRTVNVQITGLGVNDNPYVALLKANPLVAGNPLHHADYEAYKKRFADIASSRGYFEGLFETSRVDVYPAEFAADIELIFATGPRYRFGEVTFDQDVVHPEFVARYVDFRPGEPYDSQRLTSLYEALVITGNFNTIDIRRSPRPAPDLDVPITIRLTPAKPSTYSAGIGFGTDTGVKLRGGYINRRANASGHQVALNASVSPVISQAGGSYRLPLRDPRVEWLNIDAGYKHEDTETLRSDQTKLGIKRLKRRWGNWLETEFIDLAYEDYEVGLDSGTSFMLIPGISWTHTATAGPPRPVRGHHVNIQFSGTSELLGSDTEFLQVDFFGKTVWPLWSGARLLARSELGFTAKDRLRELPASTRYFAGGDVSVRGYEYTSLGPTDESGQVIGGSHLLVGSVELDQRVAEKWSVAVFVDSGNAFEDFDNMDLKTSVGGGIRWYSPLGPIRFDLGFPLDNDAPDNVRVHISLGPDL